MENESKNSTSPGSGSTTTFVQRVSAVFYQMVKLRFVLTLLIVALVEAVMAVGWPRFALVSMATAIVGIGLALVNSSLLISEVGLRAQQIYGQLILLHDEELQKLAAQRRAAPTAACPPRPN